MARITYLLVMVFALVAALEAGAAAFKCEGPENQQTTIQCSPFVRSGQQQEPSRECCIAFRALVETAKTTEDRRQLCFCGQRSAVVRPANTAKVDALQAKCGLPFIFSADRNFDCNTVN